MKLKYIVTGVVGIIFVIGWNMFLIQRDQKLFDAYDEITKVEQIKHK